MHITVVASDNSVSNCFRFRNGCNIGYSWVDDGMPIHVGALAVMPGNYRYGLSVSTNSKQAYIPSRQAYFTIRELQRVADVVDCTLQNQ